MSRGDYPYPPDEFDGAPAAGGPQGAHRAPRSRWSRWWPFAAALVVFPALAFLAVLWLSDWEGLPGVGTSAPPVAEETTGTTAPEGETPAPAATETTPPEPVETTPPAPVADLARAVEIFNSTNVSGLAAGARDRVEEAGFTQVTTGNWSGTDPAASVVYYQSATDVATAQAVAAALGLSAVEESAEQAPDGVVVVLADDYDS